ncbi:MAG: 3-dehydroquinate synthase [Verrucomicrobiota bacterium]|nr:3-dehydroquinate synthase [Verrucomicrobiota bacterium]
MVQIRASDSHYEALVGADLLRCLGSKLRGNLLGPRCVVVADETTARLFSETVIDSLLNADYEPHLIRIPPGENSKSLTQLAQVCEQMAAAGLDRSSFVVALGGGVVGDLAGFAAAVFHRGIAHVQVPTTLLSQVDSSIGGKSGVNIAAGKNLLGAIHQPALVLTDVSTLRSLPPGQLRQGYAEIIKHGIIADPTLFDSLVHSIRLLASGDPAAWEADLISLVERNVALKAAVVSRDEADLSGARAVLNFGHTIAHAIEKADGYRTILHGEAVSLGIVAACEVSVRQAGLPEEERRRVLRVLDFAGLPTSLSNEFPRAAIRPALRADKKFVGGAARFVVTPRLGSAYLTTDVTLADIEQAIAKL